jgi:hypothetical protein
LFVFHGLLQLLLAKSSLALCDETRTPVFTTSLSLSMSLQV